MIKVDKLNIDSAKPVNGEFVTIFTDGSHCPHTNAWGVGIWIRYHKEPPMEASLGGLGEYTNAFDVECHGIKFACDFVIATYDITNMIIIVQCDNIGALNKVIPNCIRKLKNAGAKFVKAKHVKAHTSNTSNRTTVNGIVDKLARAQMEIYRGESRQRVAEFGEDDKQICKGKS
jgi:hypothetical protein